MSDVILAPIHIGKLKFNFLIFNFFSVFKTKHIEFVKECNNLLFFIQIWKHLVTIWPAKRLFNVTYRGAQFCLGVQNFRTAVMAVHFERGTAHVDWCEPNYAISPNIAEFFNTVRPAKRFSRPFTNNNKHSYCACNFNDLIFNSHGK